jgi:hypothetical protein
LGNEPRSILAITFLDRPQYPGFVLLDMPDEASAAKHVIENANTIISTLVENQRK